MIAARQTDQEAEALIAGHSMKFLVPATGDLTAVCKSSVPDKFHQRLAKNRPARLELYVEVQSDNMTVATFSGTYVARKRTNS